MPAHTRTELQRSVQRAQIARLYLSGETQAAIGEVIGIKQEQVSYDIRFLQRQWARNAHMATAERLSEELARIDRLELTYWEAWERSTEGRTEQQSERIAHGASLDEAQKALAEAGTAPPGDDQVTLKARSRKISSAGDARFLAGIERCIKLRVRILGVGTATQEGLAGGAEHFKFTIEIDSRRGVSPPPEQTNITPGKTPFLIEAEPVEEES